MTPDTPATAPEAPPSDARILDRSLTHVGDREPPSRAVLALFQHTLRRMLGLRRSARAKVLPVAFVLLPYVPAMAFVGMAAIVPSEFASEAVPDPVDYYGLVATSVILFVALVGPLALTPDRRHRTLSLFLASRLTRTTYLAGAGGALLVVLLVVTLGPPLLVQVGLALLEVPGPALVLVVSRSVAAGLFMSVLLASVGLAVSSLTDNRGFAAAGTFVLFIALGIAGGVFRDVLEWPQWTAMVDVLLVGSEGVSRIYGESTELPQVNHGALLAAAATWIAAPAWFVHRRYRTLGVAR